MKRIKIAIALLTLLIAIVNAQTERYLGEIRIFSGNYAPQGWALCNGQMMSISQNQALFSILGTTYGGNGNTTFALPDLRGRLAMDEGNNHVQGEVGGETAHTLIMSEMPAHSHTTSNSITQNANSIAGNLSSPVSNYFAKNNARGNEFSSQSNATGVSIALPVNTVQNAGGSQPHNNMQPYTVVSFIIALQGIFPSRN